MRLLLFISIVLLTMSGCASFTNTPFARHFIEPAPLTADEVLCEGANIGISVIGIITVLP